MTWCGEHDKGTGDDAKKSRDSKQRPVAAGQQGAHGVFSSPTQDNVLNTGRHHENQHDCSWHHERDKRVHAREHIHHVGELVWDKAVGGVAVSDDGAGPKGEVVEERRDHHQPENHDPGFWDGAQARRFHQGEVDEEVLPGHANHEPGGQEAVDTREPVVHIMGMKYK